LARTPEVEPVIITLKEFKALLKRNDPLVVGALKDGVPLMGDPQDLSWERIRLSSGSSSNGRTKIEK